MKQLQQLIKESHVPEWTAILKELQNSRHVSRTMMQNIENLHERLQADEILADYARATVSRLVMRQIASETQAIIIREVMSRRKGPAPQGSWVLDNIEGLEKKGVKLTKAEKAKLAAHLEALGIHDREMALFRLFRETARDIAHPDLEALPHDEINRTALDSLRSAPADSKLESYGRELIETYWRTLRYFSDLHMKGTRKKAPAYKPPHHKDKIYREQLRHEIDELPIPEFREVVDSISDLSKLDDKETAQTKRNEHTHNHKKTHKRRPHRN